MILDFVKIWECVKTFFGAIKKESHEVLVLADLVVNKLKAFTGTDLGKFIIEEVEPLIPGLGPALQNWLPAIVNLLNWATLEDKVPDQVVIDGLKYLNSIQDADIKAVQHNSLSALVGKFIGLNKGAALSIQQHLIATQVIHNPEIVNPNV